jgi:hypothetical protein
MKVLMAVDKKTAILAGLEPVTPQAITVAPSDLTDAERTELTHYTDTDTSDADAHIRCTRSSHQKPPAIASATIDALRHSLATTAAQRAEEQKRNDRYEEEREVAAEKMIVDWLAKPDAEKIAWDARRDILEPSYSVYMSTADSRVRAEIDRLKIVADIENAALLERKRINEERKKEIEREKHIRLTAAVNLHGTPTQIARWTEGLMPVAEAIDLIRDHALAPLRDAGFDPHPVDEYHIKPVDSDIAVEESNKKTLDDEQYENAVTVKKIMAGWDYRYVQQYYEEDCETVKRAYIRMSKQIGFFFISCDVEL